MVRDQDRSRRLQPDMVSHRPGRGRGGGAGLRQAAQFGQAGAALGAALQAVLQHHQPLRQGPLAVGQGLDDRCLTDNKLPRPKGRGIRRFASQLPEVANSEERRKRRGIDPQ